MSLVKSEGVSGSATETITPFPIQVREFLRQQGLVLGSSSGIIVSEDQQRNDSFSGNHIGLFIPVPGKDWLFLRRKARWIGELHLTKLPDSPEEVKNKDWELRVYGRHNLTNLEELARRMNEKFSKTIGIWVTNEVEKQEEGVTDFV